MRGPHRNQLATKKHPNRNWARAVSSASDHPHVSLCGLFGAEVTASTAGKGVDSLQQSRAIRMPPPSRMSAVHQRTRTTAVFGRVRRRYWWVPYLLPTLLVYALMVVWPTVSLFYVSLLHFDITLTHSRLVGLRNYRTLFAQPLYWVSLGKTALYALLVVPPTVALAVGLALLFARAIHRATGWLQASVFLPHITPVVATSLIWVWVFNPQFGLANAVLHRVGLPNLNWLESPRWALPAVSVTTIWHSVGLYVVVVLAGLSRIPGEVLEAAAVDGAGAGARLRRVILPLLSPTVFAVTVVATIANMQSFGYIFLMTGGTHGGAGGPAYSTTTDSVLLYYTAFKYHFYGLAAAMSIVLLVLILLWTALQKAVSSRWVFYR